MKFLEDNMFLTLLVGFILTALFILVGSYVYSYLNTGDLVMAMKWDTFAFVTACSFFVLTVFEVFGGKKKW